MIWARLDRVGWRHGLEPRGGEKKKNFSWEFDEAWGKRADWVGWADK
jgi:hypothetical protein